MRRACALAAESGARSRRAPRPSRGWHYAATVAPRAPRFWPLERKRLVSRWLGPEGLVAG